MIPAPRRAMVLAAGLGLRLRPLTERVPKPLVEIGGRPLIAYALDLLVAAGVHEIVVNAHHLAEQLADFIERHGRAHAGVALHLSREAVLLETGGGVLNALPLLGARPFFVLNSDVIVRDGTRPLLARLADAFEPAHMDALLLLQPVERAFGYDGRGDYRLKDDGRLDARGAAATAPYVFTGAQVLAPALFDGIAPGVFSLRRLYDRAEAAGRLYGIVHDGAWLHVGTPEAVAEAEHALKRVS
jgi:MurNAc alpha-1-phosphate uridylyltransferase